MEERSVEEEAIEEQVEMRSLRSRRCSYVFGYLKKLPGGISIPTECLGCPRMLECRYGGVISESE